MGASGAAALLTGCSVYTESTSPTPVAAEPSPAAPASKEASTEPEAGEPTPSGDEGGERAATPALARTSDIPVGGGKIFADGAVVVTQPTAGTFKAFSTVCTHAGCAVTEVKNGTINCRCHGSAFRVADGSVKAGPAKKPLAAKKITVDGDSLRLA
jgi:Rieske Fe-S protein